MAIVYTSEEGVGECHQRFHIGLDNGMLNGMPLFIVAAGQSLGRGDKMTMEKRRLVLFHSNDLHSHLEQAAQIATRVERERAHRQQEDIILLDIGDHMDRMRMETEGSVGAVHVDILNATGYDAVVIGNNEGLTFTLEQLQAVYHGKAKFDIIGSNIHELATGCIPAWMKPYTIVHKEGLRIGLLGVTAPYTEFYQLLGWNITDPYQAVQELVQELREQVDVIIVMSHLGIAQDRYLAEHIPGIDFILGGHSHHLFEQAEQIGHTYICAAGKFGTHLGRIELEFVPGTGEYRIVSAVAESIADLPMHPAIVGMIEQHYHSSRAALSKQVVFLEQQLPLRYELESALGNLTAMKLRTWTDAEIGIVNTGQLLAPLPMGAITLEQLHRICPSPVNPCRQKLTGVQIVQALEESMIEQFQQKPIKGYGFRGNVLGNLAVDGCEIFYDPKKPPYQRIQRIVVQGVPMQAHAEYVVGTLDMFTFGIGYLSLAEGSERTYYLPEFLRDLLAVALQESAMIEASFQPRWHEV